MLRSQPPQGMIDPAEGYLIKQPRSCYDGSAGGSEQQKRSVPVGNSVPGFCRVFGRGTSRENSFWVFRHVAGTFAAAERDLRRSVRSISAGVYSLRLPGCDEQFDCFGVRDRPARRDSALVGNIEFRKAAQ